MERVSARESCSSRELDSSMPKIERCRSTTIKGLNGCVCIFVVIVMTQAVERHLVDLEMMWLYVGNMSRRIDTEAEPYIAS